MADIKVLNKFNVMRLQSFLKAVEDDGVILQSMVKIIEGALDEGGKIYVMSYFVKIY